MSVTVRYGNVSARLITRWRQRLVECSEQLGDGATYFAGQRAALVEVHRLCPGPGALHFNAGAQMGVAAA